jgi:hypothetical protein
MLMSKQNLGELFTLLHLDTHLEPKVLAIQIIYLHFIIMEWYNKNRVKSDIPPLDYSLIRDHHTLNETFLAINGPYISLVEVHSREEINRQDNRCVQTLEALEAARKGLYAVYIRTDATIYVALLFFYPYKMLLIDVSTLDIMEFDSIQNCIRHVDAVHPIYTYQPLRVINRLFR